MYPCQQSTYWIWECGRGGCMEASSRSRNFDALPKACFEATVYRNWKVEYNCTVKFLICSVFFWHVRKLTCVLLCFTSEDCLSQQFQALMIFREIRWEEGRRWFLQYSCFLMPSAIRNILEMWNQSLKSTSYIIYPTSNSAEQNLKVWINTANSKRKLQRMSKGRTSLNHLPVHKNQWTEQYLSLVTCNNCCTTPTPFDQEPITG